MSGMMGLGYQQADQSLVSLSLCFGLVHSWRCSGVAFQESFLVCSRNHMGCHRLNQIGLMQGKHLYLLSYSSGPRGLSLLKLGKCFRCRPEYRCPAHCISRLGHDLPRIHLCFPLTGLPPPKWQPVSELHRAAQPKSRIEVAVCGF